MTLEDKDLAGKSGPEIVLGVLTSIEQNNFITQRSMASELGIALGLANSYIKRCIRKGFIKIKAVPSRRYAYYLTPEGFVEKSRLTGEYLQASFGFFRLVRKQCETTLEECRQRGWTRIALFELSEMAEVVHLCASQFGVVVVGIVDARGGTLGALSAVDALEKLPPWDAVILTSVSDPQKAYDELVLRVPPDRILTPQMLRLSKSPAAPDDLHQAGSSSL